MDFSKKKIKNVIIKLTHSIFGRCCIICGKTIDPRSDEEICHDCAQEIAERQLLIPPGVLENTISLYYFEEPLRRGLHRFKYQGKKAFGIYMGRKLAEHFRNRGDVVDVVTCVPRARDGKPRMYNQSAVIAKVAAKELNLPFDPKLLRKKRGFRAQPECATPLEREENARNAYCKGTSRGAMTGQRILLVDDLFTTGATVWACCDVLKNSGAQDCLIYTLLHTRRDLPSPFLLNFDRQTVRIEYDSPPPTLQEE